MIRCIAFDFDGTLALSNAIKRDSFFQVGRCLGDVDKVLDSVLASKPGDRTRIFSLLIKTLQGQGQLPQGKDAEAWIKDLVDRYTAECEERIAACHEVPGTRTTLELLSSQGYSLFVNSATPTQTLQRVLVSRRLDGYFQATLGGPASKVQNLKEILSLHGSAPGALAFVGDNEVDRAAAVEIGCRFIGIENEFSGYSHSPETLIVDMSGLPSALDAIQAPARMKLSGGLRHD